MEDEEDADEGEDADDQEEDRRHTVPARTLELSTPDEFPFSLKGEGANLGESLKGYLKGLDDDSLLRYYDNPA